MEYDYNYQKKFNFLTNLDIILQFKIKYLQFKQYKYYKQIYLLNNFIPLNL